jgi:hypothetical protein
VSRASVPICTPRYVLSPKSAQPSVSFAHTSDHAISATLFHKAIVTWALTSQTREIKSG